MFKDTEDDNTNEGDNSEEDTEDDAGITTKRNKNKSKHYYSYKKTGPKKPGSALSCFVKENYKEFAAAHPDIGSMPAIHKELTKQWNKLSAEQKKPYQQKAMEDKERYTEEQKLERQNRKRTVMEPESDEGEDAPDDD